MGKKKTKGETWGKLRGSWRGYRAGVSKGDVKLQERAIKGIETHATSLGLKPKLPKVIKK